MADDTGKPDPTTPPAPPAPPAPIQLPDDHPLVKTLAAQKEQLKELREKARRLDEIEEANKTEAQKQADEIARLKADNAKLTVTSLRAEVAVAKGVPAALLAGSTKEELEAAADALLAFKGVTPTTASATGQGDVGKPIGDDKGMTPDEIVKAATGR